MIRKLLCKLGLHEPELQIALRPKNEVFWDWLEEQDKELDVKYGYPD